MKDFIRLLFVITRLSVGYKCSSRVTHSLKRKHFFRIVASPMSIAIQFPSRTLLYDGIAEISLFDGAVEGLLLINSGDGNELHASSNA